jgi:hypothetical protein
MKSPTHPFLRPTALVAATLALAASSVFAQTVILTDSFDTVGVGNTGFNDNASLLLDQAGSLAPLTYALASTGWDGYIQRGAGSRMLLAGYDAPNG